MLFRDDYYNSIKCDLYGDMAYICDERDLCEALSLLSMKLLEHRDSRIELTVSPGYIDIRDIKEEVLYRNRDSINRIIFHKMEFTNKLKTIGIDRPDKSDIYNYQLYLRLCYFIYILDNFIFPGCRFFDLFREENWSAENVSDANTDNTVYQRCIMEYLKLDNDLRGIDDEYEKGHIVFSDTFFNWYQDLYDNGCIDNADEELNKYLSMTDLYLDNFRYQRDIRRDVLSYIKRYEALSVICDMKANLSDEIIGDTVEIMNKFDFFSLEDYCNDYVCVRELDKAITDEEILWIVDRVTDFDLKQYSMLNDESCMLFVRYCDDKDDYFISKRDIKLIENIYRNLKVSTRYYSVRTNLNKRSDGYKTDYHSIRRSFKSDNDYSESALRDDIFRKMCRLVKSVVDSADPLEFFNYELPCNTTLYGLLAITESYDDILYRIKWYEKMTELMS